MGWIGRFARWFGWVRLAALVGLACGLVIRAADPPVVSEIRNEAFDLYQQSRPRIHQPLPVAILDIDDRSLEELGQWPWPRTRVARMVDRAAAAGAVAVAFDIIFSEPDRMSPGSIARDSSLPPDVASRLSSLPSNDAILAQAFARARVVVGQTSVRTVAGNRAEKVEMVEVPHALIGGDPSPFLQRFPDIIQNLPELEAAAAGRGVFTVRPDPDGIFRRVPLVMIVQDNLRLGLAAELLRVATGGAPFAIRSNEAGIEGVVLARQLVPTAADGTVWPYLSPSIRDRYVSAADLLAGRLPEGRLNGHLVLVGTSAIGLEDFRATALGVPMAGVEIHAQVLENILTQTLLSRPNYAIAVELVTTFVLCLLVILFAPSMAARWLIGSSLLLLGGYVATSYYLFHQHRMLLDPTFPVLATLLAVMLLSTVNYLREERQRRRIRGAFSQYVSPDLVDQLSESYDELTLGGETRELTVLFSDVLGFTTIAEGFKDDPAGLTQLMNRFLTVLSNAILAQKGTIDKFMGDAVMAFWNAPLRHDDHARLGCIAALDMVKGIAELNAARGRRAAMRGETAVAIHVGVGINTGSCVVGNMGSESRFDYTALGDPVNLASRLEGLSRHYGLDIIIGSSTAERVMDELAVLELDLVRVVGKNRPEQIYALLGDGAMRDAVPFAELRRAGQAMLADYRARDFAAAETRLDEMERAAKRAGVGLDRFAAVYRARIAEFRDHPPGQDWDGTFTSTAKK